MLAGCQVESNDDSGQVTNPTENPSDSGNGGGSNTNPKATYTITFDANGGSGEMKPQTDESGSEVTLAANAFTRDGFTFSGWATSDDGNIVHKDEAKITLTENLTLYAQWTEIGKVEKVTFSATGEVDYNDKITLTCGTEGAAIYYLLVAGTDAPTAEEFSSSKQKYSEPITITENAAISAVAVKNGLKDSETAIATFTVRTYAVSFDANGGSGTIASITEVAGTEITLPENTFTKDGYIFTGWATSADGDVSYSDKAKITLTGDITLYAKWGMTAAAAATAIAGFTDSEEHTVTVAGTISADDLTAIKEAINGNSNKPKIILDLGGTTGLTEIPSKAFYECRYLTGVNIPSSVTSIGRYAFSDSPLSSVTIPDSVTSIGEYAFSRCASLISVTIPESVTSIGDNVFDYCSSLTSVNIPSSVTFISACAFSNCYRLTTVNIPNSVTSIGMSAFSGCSSLTNVTVPDGVTSTDSTFSSCSNLTSVTIPKSVTSIGFGTFYQCGSLTTVNYEGSKEDWDKITITSSYNEALDNAALICLGSNPKEVYTPADKAAAAVATLEGGTFENPNVCTVKIISKEESDKDFLREINDKMYSRWKEYVKVNLDLSASGITEIPEKAFEGASLLGITLPNSLESIKTKAFYSTLSLKEIVIPDNVRIIESEAFYDCCYLAEITLPANLTNIGEYAFSGCDKLETVYYGGTQAQWEALKANISTTGNDKLTGANIVYNYTGE